jgi:hypothetical protein
LNEARSHEEKGRENEVERMVGWRMREGGENGYGKGGIKLGKPKNSRKIRSKPLSHASYFFTISDSLLIVEGCHRLIALDNGG